MNFQYKCTIDSFQGNEMIDFRKIYNFLSCKDGKYLLNIFHHMLAKSINKACSEDEHLFRFKN